MDLTLKEKFILLAYKPKDGITLAGTYIGYGLGGALLLELAEKKKILIEDKKVRLVDGKKTGDAILDSLIGAMQEHGKPYKIKNLIALVSRRSKTYLKPVIASLVKQRYLREVKKKFLFIPYLRHPVSNTSYRNAMIEKIRRLVLRKDSTDPDTPLLAGLAGACQFAHKFFHTKEDRKKAKKRVKEIVKESQIDATIDETVKAVQAAVMVSITTAAVAGGASH